MPDEQTIFAWAKLYREQHGVYPDKYSGKLAAIVPDADPSLSWAAIDRQLLQKWDGEIAEGALDLLVEAFHRVSTELTESKIIRWATKYRREHGNFPTAQSGLINYAEARPDTWANVNSALVLSDRGLAVGRTLAEFLDDYERKTNTLSEEVILQWVDDYYSLHGSFPTKATQGEIPGSDAETWQSIEFALKEGRKGLPKRRPKDSLADFILRHRPNRRVVPRFTTIGILAWAKHHFALHGVLPTATSGVIRDPAAKGATWAEVDDALFFGKNGLSNRVTLAKFLASVKREFEPQNESGFESISALADDQPSPGGVVQLENEGVAAAVPGPSSALSSDQLVADDMAARVTTPEPLLVDALSYASAEKVDDSSDSESTAHPTIPHAEASSSVTTEELSQAPAKRVRKSRRSVEVEQQVPAVQFTAEDLARWAGGYRRKTGHLPDGRVRGRVAGDEGPTWAEVGVVIKAGWHGYPAGLSLGEFVRAHRFDHVPLSSELITIWIETFFLQARHWPDQMGTEYVPGQSEMQWCELAHLWSRQAEIVAGWRPLDDLLQEARARIEVANKEKASAKAEIEVANKEKASAKGAKEISIGHITADSILALADAFEKRKGRPPRLNDGAIPGTGGVTWAGLNNLLRYDMAGLHHPSSLKDFLSERRRVGDEGKPEDVAITLERVRGWISSFVDSKGEYPRATSGKIEQTRFSWRQISGWLADHKHGSLAQFLYDEFGVIGNSVVNPAVQARQRRHNVRHR